MTEESVQVTMRELKMLEEMPRDKTGKYLFPLLLDINRHQQHKVSPTPILPLLRPTACKGLLCYTDLKVNRDSFTAVHETFHT